MPMTRKGIIITVGTVVIIGVALGVGIGFGVRNQHGSTGSLTANPSANPSDSPPGTRGIVGDLTYYAPGLGACGLYNTANDNIVAISHITYDRFANGPNPNTNPLCGRQIRASRNGESVVVTVVDRCEGCKANDIDLSPARFNQLAEAAEGRVKVTWEWM